MCGNGHPAPHTRFAEFDAWSREMLISPYGAQRHGLTQRRMLLFNAFVILKSERRGDINLVRELQDHVKRVTAPTNTRAS